MKVLKMPCDLVWEDLPGFVGEDTQLTYRVMYRGIAVECETPEMALGLIGRLQREHDCVARRIAASVAARKADGEAPTGTED